MPVDRTAGLPPPSRADRLIGRIEAAKRLDGPARLLETAMARPAQIAGAPAQAVRHEARCSTAVQPAASWSVVPPSGPLPGYRRRE
jgi:hypothetical protein